MTVDVVSLLVGVGIGVALTLVVSVVLRVTTPRGVRLPEDVTEPEVDSLKEQLARQAEAEKGKVRDDSTRMVSAGDLDELGKFFDES